MTQSNLTLMAKLLEDSFISIEEISVQHGWFIVAYYNAMSLLDVVYEPIPSKNDDLTVCTLLLTVERQLIKAISANYFSMVQ